MCVCVSTEIIQKRRDDNALKAKLVQATKDAEKSSEVS